MSKKYYIRNIGGKLPVDAPLNFSATVISVSSVTLTWNTVPGATSYTVRRNNTLVQQQILALTFTDTGLPPSTLETYTVSAVNGAGEGPPSAPASVTTPSGVIPTKVIGLVATATSTSQVSLSWTAQDGTTYNIFQNGIQVQGGLILPNFVITGLSAGTTYNYTVSAVNFNGQGPQSDPASATTLGGSSSLLAYLAAGGASTYQLSGFTANHFALTPLSALSYGTTGTNKDNSNATYPSLTVGTPGYPGPGGAATGIIPAIANFFTTAGPNVDTGGNGYFISTASSTPNFTANSPPNDCISLCINAQAANQLVMITVLNANPAGSGNNTWTFGGGVLGSGATNAIYLGYIDTLCTTLFSKLTKPWVFNMQGELNSGSGGFVNGQNWLARGTATSTQAAQLYRLFIQRMILKGITNFLPSFTLNLGQGNYSFGFPGTINGLEKTWCDLIGCDSQPVFNDTTAHSFMQSTGLPMWYSSAILVGDGNGPNGTTHFAVDYYNSGQSYTGPGGTHSVNGASFITSTYGDFFGAVWWPQDLALNLQKSANKAMATFPWIDRSKLPPSFSSAGGLTGG